MIRSIIQTKRSCTRRKENRSRTSRSITARLTPLQLLQSLEATTDIQESFYKDISLMKIIEDVEVDNGIY